MIKHLTLLLFLISTISVYSQDKFSLNNCVDYMFEHNKDLKNLKLVREQLEGWYSITKKSNLLPNISTSYRIADSWDQNGVGTLSNSWYAYTNVTVFNGARFPQIKKQKNTIVRHDIAIFWTESSLQRDLTILYYSAVLTKKQIEIIKNQIKEINDILATKIRNVDST
ncbi:MAG: TolC family protein, partial [Bacteroidota bacterium]|nr:TolC family protein [Bacteroidota bacterium]